VGNGLGTTIKYLRGAADSGFDTAMKYLRRTTSNTAGSGLDTTIKYLRGAASNGLGTTAKYLRRTMSGAAGSSLGTTINFLRRTTVNPGNEASASEYETTRDSWKRTSLCSRLSRMPHGRHIKDEIKVMRLGNFSLGGSSHQTGDAAFNPAAPRELQHSRANTDSHNTQNTRVKTKGTYTAKRACQFYKQVGRLRPGQAAPRWFSLCSPRRTETASTSGERSPEKTWEEKGSSTFTHARANEIRRFIVLERAEPLTSEAKRSYQPGSLCKHGSDNAKGHSAQPGMFWSTHHTKPDPKSMPVLPLCLWGV